MNIVYQRHGVTVHHAEALAVLRDMPDASVDAVVTDPPYGLSDLRSDAVVSALTAWANGDRERVPAGNGFMGRKWDAFVPPPAVWDECLRVLRPGGHLAAFAGSRTAGLMDLSIRMAGFEIRDGLQWLHGQGFPKGLDVGKAIDKARDDRAGRAALGRWLRDQREAAGLAAKQVAAHWPSATGGLTGCVANWELGLNLPTGEQWAKLRDLLGFGDEMDAEHARLSARQGTWGNERADRIVTGPSSNMVLQPTQAVTDAGTPVLDAARQWQGWNTSLRPSFEPIILARKPLSGTVAQTVLAHGTGALNIGACRTGADARVNPAAGSLDNAVTMDGGPAQPDRTPTTAEGRWPANVLLSHAPLLDEHGQPVGDACHAGCVEGCAVAELDGQSGVTPSGGKLDKSAITAENGIYGKRPGELTGVYERDSGGASRYFPTFRWEAKAPTSERPQVNGVSHPTTKPLGLIRWLVRLLTPPGGLVVDCFAGSGTTGHAARAEGMQAVLVEREADYIPLIRARLDARERTPATSTGEVSGDEPLDLLDLLDEGGAA